MRSHMEAVTLELAYVSWEQELLPGDLSLTAGSVRMIFGSNLATGNRNWHQLPRTCLLASASRELLHRWPFAAATGPAWRPEARDAPAR